MPKLQFTALSIKALKPSKKSVEYFDEGRAKGDGSLALRVSPQGKMTWFVMYRGKDGKQKRFILGTYPSLSLSKARESLAALKIGSGADPVAERKAEIEREKEAEEEANRKPTVRKLWEVYLEKRSNQGKAESTNREEDRKWKIDVEPYIGDMLVEEVTPVDLSNLLERLSASSPVSANRLHSFLRVLFKPAIAKGWITIHPMQWIDKPAKEKPRKRILSDEEIKDLWQRLDKVQPNARDSMKLLLLTAQRKGEIFKMKWEDIDDNWIWHQKENKTDSVHLLPLSSQVISILKNKPKISEWVFPSNRNASHVIDVKKVRIALNKKMGGEPWTEHDLRRTARTLMSRLKIKHHVRERVLNHSQGGMVRVYDQHDYLDEKRDALKKLGNEINRIIGIKTDQKSNVYKMGAREAIK